MDKKVTVIVPIYNCEQYLNKCIQSIIAQTYTYMQIILVNDGSTDKSCNICKEYESKFSFITVIDKENEGPNSARLSGLKHAEADYIVFVDADDWIDSDFIERLMYEMQDADVICSNISRIYGDNKIVEEQNRVAEGIYQTADERKHIYERMLWINSDNSFGVLPYSCNKIFKKEILMPILEKVDCKICDGEDVAFIFPYLLNTKKIVISNYSGYNYVYRKNSLCNMERETNYYNESCLYVWLYETFNKSEYRDILIPQLTQYMLMMIWKRNPTVYIGANKLVFPYSKVKQGANIVVYGDGSVGSAYVQQIFQSGYCKIIAIADKKYEGVYNKDELKIAPRELVGLQFDNIVIAIADKEIIEQVCDKLVELGVPQEKIVW